LGTLTRINSLRFSSGDGSGRLIILNIWLIFLKHPRHRDGLHIRRYLIAVSGLDYPFVGLAPIKIHPQHFQLRCYRLLLKPGEPRLQRAPHCCASTPIVFFKFDHKNYVFWERGAFYRAQLGDPFVDYVIRIKRAEWDRYLAAVSEWEEREYLSLF